MALTKVTGQVIKNTTDVTVGVLTVTNTLAVGGTVSIGGTLTYEDVTNVDAVGLITARNGIVVGSGITLSKDGDVFFTGIATGNGSGLTALNASNIGSGTVPTARLGSGTASSSTFLRGDSTFQTVNTDLVSDTSPQLGGDLASNSNDILMAANDRIVFGTDKLRVKHTDSNADIENTTGNIVIKNDSSSTSEQIILQAKGGEDSIKAIADGAVELYHNDSKKFETTSAGVTVTGHLTVGTATLYSTGNLLLGDSDEIRFGDGEDLKIYHSGGTNYCDIASGQQLYFRVAGSNKFYVQSGGAQFVGSLYGDDSNKIELGSSQDLKLYHNGTDSYIDNATGNLAIRTTGATHISLKTNDENAIYCGANGAVQLYYDNSLKAQTTSTGMQTVEAVKMKYGSNGVNLKQVFEQGVGNTATCTATVPDCVGGGTVTVTVMHNGNTSITTTKMFSFMARGNSTANLGSEIFSINHLSNASFNVSAATLGVTVQNNSGAHAKVRVTFDITANIAVD